MDGGERDRDAVDWMMDSIAEFSGFGLDPCSSNRDRVSESRVSASRTSVLRLVDAMVGIRGPRLTKNPFMVLHLF